MRTLTYIDALSKVKQILDGFSDLADKGVMRMTAHIENVSFTDIVRMYGEYQTRGANVQLYLPGEVGTETIQIGLRPANGCYICIESEPCVNYKPKINSINYN